VSSSVIPLFQIFTIPFDTPIPVNHNTDEGSQYAGDAADQQNVVCDGVEYGHNYFLSAIAGAWVN